MYQLHGLQDLKADRTVSFIQAKKELAGPDGSGVEYAPRKLDETVGTKSVGIALKLDVDGYASV
jgi:hypothetical protein